MTTENEPQEPKELLRLMYQGRVVEFRAADLFGLAGQLVGAGVNFARRAGVPEAEVHGAITRCYAGPHPACTCQDVSRALAPEQTPHQDTCPARMLP